MLTLYGIPNCDTVKKARAALDARGVAYHFHDFKKQGVPEPALDGWIERLGWEALLNRQGSTWRRLDEATRTSIADARRARELMRSQPSVIRRPVVEREGVVLGVGLEAVLALAA